MRERGLKLRGITAGARARAVAPRMGVWIEIPRAAAIAVSHSSLPVRERGLKYDVNPFILELCSRSPYGSVD
nr:hypothetical protein [Paenibacillus zanthoxyli]